MVTRFDAAGDTVFTRRFRYTPEPVPDAYLDSTIRARLNGYRGRTSDLNGVERALRSVYSVAPFFPLVRSVYLSIDGSVWLSCRGARWLVLAPDGSPLGELRLEGSRGWLWAEGGRVWWVERDSLDVPWLVRDRIRDAAVAHGTGHSENGRS